MDRTTLGHDEIVDRGERVFVFRDGAGCLGHARRTDTGRWTADDGYRSRTFPTQTQAVNALRRGISTRYTAPGAA